MTGWIWRLPQVHSHGSQAAESKKKPLFPASPHTLLLVEYSHVSIPFYLDNIIKTIPPQDWSVCLEVLELRLACHHGACTRKVVPYSLESSRSRSGLMRFSEVPFLMWSSWMWTGGGGKGGGVGKPWQPFIFLLHLLSGKNPSS